MTLTRSEAAFGKGVPMPADAVTFDGLFGWYRPGLSRRGVVLCGTLGYEQLAAYRGWRQLAVRLAAAGHPTLRFDYPGEGDSADPASPIVASHVGAIRSALRFLRKKCGVEEVALVGLRLGGTLAALAAEEEAIESLVLLSPFASGRAYLREMSVRASAIDQLPDGRPFPQDQAAPVFGGFRPPPALLASLGRVDLTRIPAAPVPRVLMLGPDPAGLAARYRGAGSDVTVGPFAGLASYLSNTLISETPHEVFARVTDFIGEGAALRTGGPVFVPPAAPIAGPGWSESVLRFGGNVGILCAPREPVADMPGLLFINSGVNPRSGYGRQTSDLARVLAADGVRSLRMDLRGVGDGEDRTEAGRPMYALDALDEVIAAIDRLDEGNGVVVTGTCSGAFLGFHALCRDTRVRAGIVANLYCFDWDPEKDLETALRSQFRSASTYATLLRRPDAWKRMLRGEVRVGAILSRLAATALTRLRVRSRQLLPFVSSTSVAGRINAIRRRGARLALVFSAGEPGLAEVATHLGRSPSALSRRLGHPVVVLPDTDHNLSTEGAQEKLREIVGAALTEAALETGRYRSARKG